MPYITEDRRAEIDAGIPPQNVGELTYAIYWQLARYRRMFPDKFQTHADIIAACDCAKEEYRRRVLDSYEDVKIEVNGDVY